MSLEMIGSTRCVFCNHQLIDHGMIWGKCYIGIAIEGGELHDCWCPGFAPVPTEPPLTGRAAIVEAVKSSPLVRVKAFYTEKDALPSSPLFGNDHYYTFWDNEEKPRTMKART